MSLQICIMTPERIFWNGQSEEIVLPTNTGEMGVLKNHAPIITGLDVGAMLVRTKEGWNSFAIMGGFGIVGQNRVILLVNAAESSETINAESAENDLNTAKTALQDAKDPKQQVEANCAFKRAKARFQVVKNLTKNS
uniref:ATP synthase epsilon chain, chloroplastic n=1 Tax=Floydiella terrestris TaxID=51328 RepID=E2DSJ9_FLOTE|nr:CF1 epsilon subunit of ATP synthase [Floydiella terrestris]YP_010500068.1 CF1 epsilon subunit of ATP synthase [Gormaniella terricola]ACZ58432.1 CF1 epsilon subunit of ATP synthase [Floydiella terrestris]UWV18245.1 CF1 epsilon subunit of ATP synthase [Gormaniella terricola]